MSFARYTGLVSLKPSPFAFLSFIVAAWINRQQVIVIEYLRVQNRMLRERVLSKNPVEFV